MESPELHPKTYEKLLYDENNTSSQWDKDGYLIKQLWENWIAI